MRAFFVYILASHKDGALYVGVTNDMERRLAEHRAKEVDGFSRRYAADHLVHVEAFPDALSAIGREKRLKKWPRAWKVALIEKENPERRDLSKDDPD